jgi:hypothetical protein
MAEATKPADELHVLDVDIDRLIIKVGSTATDPQTKLYQVTSEDARVLAIKAAREKGLTNNTIKRHGLQYGDDTTGQVNPAPMSGNGKPVAPFLVVELSGAKTGGSGFVGDSRVAR